MSTVTAIPLRGQPPFLGPASEPIMPDFGEPNLSPVGVPDELSAAYANSYAAAHLEADELDELRNAAAGAELSPAEFRAIVEGECAPGRRWKCEAWSYLYSGHYGPGADQCRYHATVYASDSDKRGVPLKADSLRDLARLIVELDRHMTGMATVNLVVAV